MLYGAIIGDIIGSRFEFKNDRSYIYSLFTKNSTFTDDTLLTLAVAYSLICKGDLETNLIHNILTLVNVYPNLSYGDMFIEWIENPSRKAYGSKGNGALMRISPCIYFGKSLKEIRRLARRITDITHNSPEAEKAVDCLVSVMYLLKNGKSKKYIRYYVNRYYYKLNTSLEYLQNNYTYSELAEDTIVPVLICFLESYSFESAIRNGISIGGDSDTICSIIGSIAELYYNIPVDFIKEVYKRLPDLLLSILHMFINKIGTLVN